jgi:hypothetical protein
VSDKDETPQEGAPKKRGEAAWKENMARISERNDAARKAGRQRRDDYDQARAQARNDADARRRAQLLDRSRTD